MTTYAYDTEFLENGRTIELISIGIVADDGREYYAVNVDMPTDRIAQDPWLMQNVWPHLPLVDYNPAPLITGARSDYGIYIRGSLDQKSEFVKPQWVIRNEVRAFLTAGASEENPTHLWADYGAYDHVVLAQLFGRMIDLPEGIPMFTNDLQTVFTGYVYDDERPDATQVPVSLETEHHALNDARSVMAALKYLRIA